jgi:hypothetical protein
LLAQFLCASLSQGWTPSHQRIEKGLQDYYPVVLFQLYTRTRKLTLIYSLEIQAHYLEYLVNADSLV